MEIGLDEAIPTYAGGLGILAGDTVRSAARLFCDVREEAAAEISADSLPANTLSREPRGA